MARPRIYITQPVAQSAIERLRTVADVDLNPDTAHIVTKPELLAAVRSHDLLFCLLHDKLDGEVIAANPALKAIASMKTSPNGSGHWMGARSAAARAIRSTFSS